MRQDDIDHFMQLYINCKRKVLNNQYIKLPKEGSKQHNNLIRAAELIEEIHADPADYLLNTVKWLAPLRIFPSPSHLISRKAVDSYRRRQALKNIYWYKDFTVANDNVLIHSTLETISYKDDLMCPIDKDIRLKYVMHLIKTDYPGRKYYKTDRQDVNYAMIKLKYFNKPIPNELKTLKERLDEDNTDSM